MSTAAADLFDERLGTLTPAEEGHASLETKEPRRAGDDPVEARAPDPEEDENANASEENEETRDGRVEFYDEGKGEVDDDPENGGTGEQIEGVLFAQQDAAIVESALRKRRDEETHADQQKREVAGVGGVGHRDAERADARVIPQPVAEGESAECDQGVSDQERDGENGVPERVGRRCGHLFFYGTAGTVSSSNESRSGEGSQPLAGSGEEACRYSRTSNKSTGGGMWEFRTRMG